MNIHVRDEDRDPAVIELPKVVFPVQLEIPAGFVPADPATWPQVEGRLELVSGKLLYMPPTGGWQSETTVDVIVCLDFWVRAHPDFTLRANEAGMKLGDDVRTADVAIWRASDAAAQTHEVPRHPPILAVEIAGRDDTETHLRNKAAWYLGHGVCAVWLVFPEAREVVAIAADRESQHGPGETLPPIAELPGLSVAVADLFRKVSR